MKAEKLIIHRTFFSRALLSFWPLWKKSNFIFVVLSLDSSFPRQREEKKHYVRE